MVSCSFFDPATKATTHLLFARPKVQAAQEALKSAPGEGADGIDFGKWGCSAAGSLASTELDG